MPQLGEFKKGREIDKYPSMRYVWHACMDCGKERWVIFKKGKPISLRCSRCAYLKRDNQGIMVKGEGNIHWKGGRTKTTSGYINILLRPDDFFYPMAQARGYVPEHRLVMAKHLNRCLLPWEIVHHRNSIKDDNRFENLELLPDKRFHLIDILTKAHITILQKTIDELKEKIRELEELK